MATRLKTTVFGRFFLVMIIVIPLAYFGASYYNGVNGIQNIKDYFNSYKNVETKALEVDPEDVTTWTREDLIYEIERLESVIKSHEERITALEQQLSE